MKALVTGASGFVGSALCRTLLAAGHEVVAMSRTPEQARKRIGQVLEVRQGSVAFPHEVAEAARGADVVFHAAGLPPGRAPERVLRWLHIAGTENVLRAARHVGVRRVVYMSTAEVSLQEGDRMHWDEARALPKIPASAYARSKLMAEEIALAESDATLEVTALRPALLWGEGAVDFYASLVREGRSGGIQLYGGGRNIVATTHIDNLMRAALLAAEAEAAPSRAYYITDAEFLEAREFFSKLSQALSLPAPREGGLFNLAWFKATLSRLGGDGGAQRALLINRAKSALFDLSQATRDLNYTASIDLDQAMQKLSAWVQAQGGPDALLAQARPAPKAADVDAQVQAAGGD